jgi:hypothetical protein
MCIIMIIIMAKVIIITTIMEIKNITKTALL